MLNLTKERKRVLKIISEHLHTAITVDEKKNAPKEIVQEVALYGLSRAGSFYGRTALHNLRCRK